MAGWGMLHRLRGWTPLGITIIFKMDKKPKYWTVRFNTGHLATLLVPQQVL